MSKQSSERLTELASAVLRGHEPTRQEIMSLAASVLAQRETPMTRFKRWFGS
jgi:hypothetical protein